MKQLVQSVRSGEMQVAEVPVHKPGRGMVLVRNVASLVSAGTERTAVEFAQKGFLGKARSRPDLVDQVMNKVRKEGLFSAVGAALAGLDQPQSLGYSTAGVVLAVGAGVTEFRAGDRVACAGANYAVHAEVVSVPKNLVAHIPLRATGEISFEEAAFSTLGAIALHGIRLAEAHVDEAVAVIGLGLLGLLAIQIVKASGCRVVGMDPDKSRCELATRLGCDAVATNAEQFAELVEITTGGLGADAVLITAATSSNDPVELAAQVARGRANVISVGAVGTTLPRKEYFQKELSFKISRSYGPGRYDPGYEEHGNDYPVDYVRWTENRNLQSFLSLLQQGKVQVAPLITHRFPIAEATQAYQVISGAVKQPFLGIVIRYSEDPQLAARMELSSAKKPRDAQPGHIGIGMLGAGAFGARMLLPAIKDLKNVGLEGLCTASGITGWQRGEKFGFRYCTTEENELLRDPAVHSVVIATRHDRHAEQVIAALEAGKHVFCEKPLCLNDQELDAISLAYSQQADKPALLVGFNRRFAPLARQMKAFLAQSPAPLLMNYRVNAGAIPSEHWTQDAEVGGGRIIGEGCHFIDLLTFLCGSLPIACYARSIASLGDDHAMITVEFENGSVGQINYAANGDKSFSKERVEAFGGGAVAVLEDFRSLELVRSGSKRMERSRLSQDKGHRAELAAFVESIRTGKDAIPFTEIAAVTRATFRIVDSLRSGQRETIQQ